MSQSSILFVFQNSNGVFVAELLSHSWSKVMPYEQNCNVQKNVLITILVENRRAVRTRHFKSAAVIGLKQRLAAVCSGLSDDLQRDD